MPPKKRNLVLSEVLTKTRFSNFEGNFDISSAPRTTTTTTTTTKVILKNASAILARVQKVSCFYSGKGLSGRRVFILWVWALSNYEMEEYYSKHAVICHSFLIEGQQYCNILCREQFI